MYMKDKNDKLIKKIKDRIKKELNDIAFKKELCAQLTEQLNNIVREDLNYENDKQQLQRHLLH
jgi:hypothetical protein